MYNEADAYAPGADDDFLKRLSETNGTPGKPFYMPNGTPFFCSAGGVLLKRGLADWPSLRDAERKAGAVVVPAGKPDAGRAKGRRLTRPPANTLILRTYVRGLKKNDKDELFAAKVIDWDYNQKLPAEPNRDFLWLREAEWQSLIPAEPMKGRSFAVPDAVRDRICCWHIAGGYHGLPGYYPPDRFQARAMTLTVADVTPKEITLRLTGNAVVKNGPTYRFAGVLRIDAAKKTFTRFDLIALADEGRELERRPQNVAPFRHYGIAIELAGERTDDLLPPFYLRENVGTPENYFANRAR